MSNSNENTLRVRAESSGRALNVSVADTRQVISATNNRAQYFADLAKKYKDEAKTSRDEAQYYAEQNSDVTFEYIDGIKAELEGKISLKQDIGNYALRSELPIDVSELNNDAEYVSETQMQTAINTAVPTQTGENGKFLATNGSSTVWATPKTHNLFDFQWADHLLNDQNWLKADTFSWQSGTTYSEAYAHLTSDIEDKTLQSETISGVTIQFYLADDGHKICPASQENNVASIYSATGVAWYYILDEDNQKFKLPRTKYGFIGLRDEVGKFVPQDVKLPNITGQFGTCGYGNDIGNNGAFTKWNMGQGTYSGGNSRVGWNFNASLCSSVYSGNGTDTNIQQKSTQMYLYFYVGEFSQTATEQTAGLNAELFNNKVDLNFSNIDSTAKGIIVSNCIPDYTNVIEGSMPAWGSWIKCAKDSFVCCWGSDPYTEGITCWVSPDNGTTTYIVGVRSDDQNGYTECTSFTFFVPKDWYFKMNSENAPAYRIYPLKGAN